MGENIRLSVLEQLTVTDLEEYMEYLKCHPSVNNEDVYNTERGIMRKVSSLKSFYNYFYRNERIEKNPASLLRLPKLHEKEITRLEIDEVARLLDEVEEGEKLTERQKLYHERTKVRDLAMLTLLLGTGLRVSECVGLNINDVTGRLVSRYSGRAERNPLSISAMKSGTFWKRTWMNARPLTPFQVMRTLCSCPCRKKG